MFLQCQQTLRIRPIQEVHQVFLFFDKASLGQLSLQFTEYLLLA